MFCLASKFVAYKEVMYPKEVSTLAMGSLGGKPCRPGIVGQIGTIIGSRLLVAVSSCWDYCCQVCVEDPDSFGLTRLSLEALSVKVEQGDHSCETLEFLQENPIIHGNT
jgi:hypothetical protein